MCIRDRALRSRMKTGGCQLGLNSCHPSRLLRRAELWMSLGRQGHHVLRQGRHHLPELQEQKLEPTLSVLRLSLSRDDLLIGIHTEETLGDSLRGLKAIWIFVLYLTDTVNFPSEYCKLPFWHRPSWL